MTPVIYLYAVLEAPPAPRAWRGMRGERLAFLRAGGLVVATGRLPSAPAPSAAALRRHDAVVRRLARALPAVLPVRFGTTVPEPSALGALLRAGMPALRRALRHVAGREQMTLRVFGSAAASPAPPRPAARSGPGTRYLAARRRAVSAGAPAVAHLRAGLGKLVRDERVEPSETPPLLASVYHLVDRGDRRAYARALRELRCRLADVRVVSSGPWAPYAFAPEPTAPQDS